MDDVIAEATRFIAECYGSKKRNSLSEVQLKLMSGRLRCLSQRLLQPEPEGPVFYLCSI